jgi:abortive infection bacteriophage resistance protein
MVRPFTKPALSIADQLALLEARGLIVNDRPAALHALKHISYYRLRAYWLYFEKDPTDPAHALRPGTSFDDILSLYDFDRRLRLLINDGLERIEVASRGSWAHFLAMTSGPHGYLDAALYSNSYRYARNLTQLQDEVDRSHDTFIDHYKATYGNPPLPPVWMAAEVMSFGLLSKWISTLGSKGHRQSIARPLGLSERVATSFLHHLVTVRNICAHHGRLWNRRLTVTPILPNNPPELAAMMNPAAPRQLYNSLAIMLHVMGVIAPSSEWRKHLRALLETHPAGDLRAMGFPDDWRSRKSWRVTE